MSTLSPAEAATSTQPEPLRHQRYGGSATTVADRFVWHPVEVAPPADDPRAVAGRHVLVIGGSASERSLVASSLSLRDATVSVLPSTEESADGTRTAVRAAVLSVGDVDGIVDLGVDGVFDVVRAERHDAWRAALTRSVAVLQEVYDDWAAETDARRCFYLAVTRMGGRMGYDRQGVQQPLGGIWAGLAKSLPHELPTCRVKVLDLGSADEPNLGSIVAREIADFDFYEVGYRSGVRYTLGAETAPCPPARLELGAEDVVLVSGGGRGVGFAFARELARRVGCRVVVTGRSALPEGEPWLTASPAEYAALRQQRMRDAGAGRIGAVRRENERRDALRQLAANLADAARDGLPVEYRACDFLDATAVDDLVRSLGDRLRVVVHNAGVAAPTRLRNKTTDTSVRVVESKLVPFVNLVQALHGRSVDYFCNVGSVAGRMGGMIGQIDYAAANEVLSRLGFWAQETLGLPVATLCWTTWEQIGLIANYEAALRYGAAMSVHEGVTRWVDELTAAEPTEAMFLGRIGTALSPTQIKGFLKFGDHPDLPWLMSRQHYLGEVEAYAPFRSLRSRSELFAAKHPCLAEVTLDGAPILPVSLALEGALSVGDWVAPEGWPLLHLRELRNLRVDLPALGFEAGLAVVLKAGTGAWDGGRWVVRVALTTVERRPLLSCDVVYQAEPGSAAPAPSPVGEATAWESSPAGGPATGLGWRGVLYRHGPWLRAGDEVSTSVTPVHDSDAWATPYPPRAVLPSAAVESMVEGIALASTQPAARTLYAERIEWTPTGAGEHRVAGRPAEGSWWVADTGGEVILRCHGAVLR